MEKEEINENLLKEIEEIKDLLKDIKYYLQFRD